MKLSRRLGAAIAMTYQRTTGGVLIDAIVQIEPFWIEGDLHPPGLHLGDGDF